MSAQLLMAAVCGTALTTREFSPEMLEKFDDPGRVPTPLTVVRQHAPSRLSSGSGWGRWGWRWRTRRTRARRSTCCDLRCARVWSVPADGQSHAQRECVHDHSRRTRIHVGVHALAGAGAVLLLVHAVRDFRLHHSRRGQAALRRQQSRIAGLRGRRATGSACCSRLTTAWARSPRSIIPYFVQALRHARARTGSICGWAPPACCR